MTPEQLLEIALRAEAAAQEAVRRPFVNDTPTSIADAIRALPVPEDK